MGIFSSLVSGAYKASGKKNEAFDKIAEKGFDDDSISEYAEGSDDSMLKLGSSLFGKSKDSLNTDKNDKKSSKKKKKKSKSDKKKDKSKSGDDDDDDKDGDEAKTGKLKGKGKDKKSGGKATKKSDTLVFSFEIDGISCAEFRKCDGLSITTDMLEVPVGGENTATPKFYTSTKYGNVTLSNGLVKSEGELLKWLQGTLTSKGVTRKSCSLILKNLEGKEIGRWNIFGAMPIRWDIPIEGCGSKGKLSMDLVEKIEMAIERFEYVKA